MVPDPVDARLLAVLAELGGAAVHDVAARVGMDPREVAVRLVSLSAAGLPLVVGVHCDPHRIRAIVDRAALQRTGPDPAGARSGYGVPAQPGSGGFPARQATGAQPALAPAGPSDRAPEPVSVWGPPQTSSWARGDQPWPAGAGPGGPTATVGDVVEVAEAGTRLSIRLVDVVDPADVLFRAAGYQLRPGERAVVVHTEVANHGGSAYTTLPDLYLTLVTADGIALSKAPVTLPARPPHRIGVRPGDVVGGHTVYVVPEATVVAGVRWSARPDDGAPSLTWTLNGRA